MLLVSEPVNNLKILEVNGPDVSSSEFKAEVLISWELPCKANGVIKHFYLEFFGTRAGYQDVYFDTTVTPDLNSMEETITFKETRLKPEYKYEVNVAVVNKDVLNKSVGVTNSFDAPAGSK